MVAAATVRAVTVDVSDLDRGVRFWGTLLGCSVSARMGGYVWFDEIAPGIRLVLQQVAETGASKNRVHLDLVPTDADATARLVEELGGHRVEDVDEAGYSLTVMADPDGNEFCLTRRLSDALAAPVASSARSLSERR